MATKRKATKRAATKRTPAKRTSAKRSPAKAKPAAAPKRAARRRAQRVKAVPSGFHTATPYLVVRGAARALEFYARAFGAKERTRMPGPDGSIAHAEMKIGDSMVMLADENPDWGAVSPQTLGGSGTSVMLYVRDADAFVARAVAAGATVVAPLTDMFWGDRYGKVQDPFGHVWSVATHREDVSPQEMKRRLDEFNRQMAQG